MIKLRPIFKFGPNGLLLTINKMSTNTRPFLDVELHKDGIAVIGIQRPPVNSFNLELLEDMNKSLNELENERCKAIILSSNLPHVFSGGIDLMELLKPTPERLSAFIKVFHEVSIKLYGSDAVTTVAINVGLVDELAVDNHDAIEKCKQFIRKFDKVPPQTRAAIKHNMRQTLLNDIRQNKEEYMKDFVNTIIDPKTQANMEVFVKNMNSRNKSVKR